MKEIFITCATGLESLLQDELRNLGIKDVRKGFRGVFAPKEIQNVYQINYCSRLATRVLWPLNVFPCPNKEALYRCAKNIRWERVLNLKKTFAIDSNVSHVELRNSMYASQLVKDALCDYFREHTGERPSVAMDKPDVRLNLFIHNNTGTISLDTSGDPLYKRGYRAEAGAAPLQESLASAILRLAAFSFHDVLYDPFCGSGTFLMEAAMDITHTPPGSFRQKWGFEHLTEHQESEWSKVKQKADNRRNPLTPGKLFGSDKDPKAIAMSHAQFQLCGFDRAIEIAAKDIRSCFPTTPPTLVVCNPPYGKRLHASFDLYRSLGQFIKTKCAPTVRAFILASDPQMIAETQLPVKNTTDLMNGGLEVSLFELSV